MGKERTEDGKVKREVAAKPTMLLSGGLLR